MSSHQMTEQTQRCRLTGRFVLVVEDEYFLADDISRALSTLGARVVGPIGHIDDVIDVVDRAERIDGAVLDVNVRSEMIFPIARSLRARNVPFVFTTGYDKNAIEAEFHDVQLWEKPIDVVEMTSALADLIGQTLIAASSPEDLDNSQQDRGGVSPSDFAAET